MRIFQDLSTEEQDKAVENFSRLIIQSIAIDDLIPDCLLNFENIIQSAQHEAEELHTPWFLEEILWDKVYNHPDMQTALLEKAKQLAERTSYLEEGDYVIKM